MLHNQVMETKDYRVMFEEALEQVPIYSDEWTNFNAADPGITMLESLSLFAAIQQGEISRLSPEVMEGLLKLVGFTALKSQPARLLLQVRHAREDFEIPLGQSFALGDITYETTKTVDWVGSRILGLYGQSGEKLVKADMILGNTTSIGVKIFGETPAVGDCFYIICDRLPEAGSEMFFYMTCEDGGRNAFMDQHKDFFAELEWECYTDQGFVRMNSRDYTGGFVTSGEIRMRLPAEMAPAIYEELPQKGCCIRGRLVKASFDRTPVLTRLDPFLFEVWQRKTHSYVKGSKNSGKVMISRRELEGHYLNIFVREEKNGHYYKYDRAPYGNAQGRFYDLTAKGDNFIISFSRENHGFGPERGRDAVKVLSYDEISMRKFNLGQILGYDDQIIDLAFTDVVKESVSILLERNMDGVNVYDFVRPSHQEYGELDYQIAEKEGKILIRDPGDYVGAKVYLGACATGLGEKGRVRAGNSFEAPGMPAGLRFVNPVESTGGRFRETPEETRKRFLRDIEQPFACVTEKDYETLVKNTPGLCIKKVHAYRDPAKNRVILAVLAGFGRRQDKLSEDYRRLIMEQVDTHRLLCTNVALVDPVFVPVHVSTTVYIKPHYTDVEDKIRQVLLEKLEYIDSDRKFGQPLSYEEIFLALSELPFVAFVYDLKLGLGNKNHGSQIDQDIRPVENGLIVPGTISIEAITYYGK